MSEPLTVVQKAAIELLWFRYGNGGSCHTNENHKFLQRYIEGRPADAEVYRVRITESCRNAFEKVMAGDYSELRKEQRVLLEELEKFGTV